MAYDKRHVAIMFTDIQGYTRLMQQSEELGVQIRARHREVFEPSTLNNNGTVIQYYGDGTLSIFDNCVDAVECAYQLQRLYQREPVIPVRIGIHVGDILLTKDDIVGDSVNLASRVESLGKPGAILISEDVYDEIEDKKSYPAKSMGSFHFKNDSRRRKIYALTLPGLQVPKRRELRGKLEKKDPKKRLLTNILSSLLLSIAFAFLIWKFYLGPELDVERIAVLPFENRIGLENQQYLVDGIHEELTLRLAQVGLNVMPYTKMKQYMGTNKSIIEIAKELDVEGLVEGSVARVGEEIKIRVQLISGRSEEYLMKPFESQDDLKNVEFLYRNVVRSIASEIEMVFSPEAEAKLNRVKAVDPEAYDYFLRGRYHLNRGTTEDVNLAIDYYHQCLRIDSLFGPAYSGLVESYLLQGFGAVNAQDAYTQFNYYVQKAIQLDEQFRSDHHQLAVIKIFVDLDWEGAARELRSAIEEQPNSWEPYDSYCQLMWAMGRMEESIAAGEKAVELAPDAHFARCDLAWAYFFAGQYEAARREVDKTIAQHGDECPHHANLDIKVALKETPNSEETLESLTFNLENRGERFPEDNASIRSTLGYLYALAGKQQKALEIAHSLEEQGYLMTAPIHLALGNRERALDILKKSIEQRQFYIFYVIKSAPELDPLREDPRFKALLEQIGLLDSHQIPLPSIQ